MTERTIKVRHTAGLHMRPASELCTIAMGFDSEILICFRNKTFNAKSLLSILSACVQQEDEIRLVCSGSDEEEAAEKIVRFIEQV